MHGEVDLIPANRVLQGRHAGGVVPITQRTAKYGNRSNYHSVHQPLKSRMYEEVDLIAANWLL
jgi:hypothetical protein